MHAQGKDFLHRDKPENGVAKSPPGVTQRLFELIPSANDSVSSLPQVLRAPQPCMHCIHFGKCQQAEFVSVVG